MTDLEALVVAAYRVRGRVPGPWRAAAGGRWSATPSWSHSRSPRRRSGSSSDRQFLGLIGRVLPGWFPHLPDQSQYNRRLRQLVGLISIVQQRLARWLDTGDVRLSDGALIGVANYPGCQRRSEFAGSTVPRTYPCGASVPPSWPPPPESPPRVDASLEPPPWSLPPEPSLPDVPVPPPEVPSPGAETVVVTAPPS